MRFKFACKLNKDYMLFYSKWDDRIIIILNDKIFSKKIKKFFKNSDHSVIIFILLYYYDC